MKKKKAKNVYVNELYKKHILHKKYRIIILYGGRDSGKSYFVGGQYIPLRMHEDDYFKGISIRKTLTACKDSVFTEITDGMHDMNLQSYFNYKQNPLEIHHVNGNSMYFRGLDKPRKLKSFKGASFIWVEEAEDLSEEEFRELLVLLRGGKEEDQTLILTYNPKDPNHFTNKLFVDVKPDKVLETEEDGSKKVWEKDLEIDIDGVDNSIKSLIVLSTYKDNKFITPMRKAVIEGYRDSDPYLYNIYAKGKYATPEGAVFKRNKLKRFNIKELNRRNVVSIIGVIDTASSGTDSATLGIYAKIDNEEYYLLDVVKDASDPDIVIPAMIDKINMWGCDEVHIEKNHEGLYFKEKISEGVFSGIYVDTFHSSENKHQKILGQSGKIKRYLYFRNDYDSNSDYADFLSEVVFYNRDQKLNDKVDCPDNLAMYFKEVDSRGKWGL